MTKPVLPPSQIVAHAIDPGLEAVLMRYLAKTPAERYPDVRELRDASRALPLTDWDDAAARAFWRELRETEIRVQEAADTPTKTISVDIGARDALSA